MPPLGHSAIPWFVSADRGTQGGALSELSDAALDRAGAARRSLRDGLRAAVSLAAHLDCVSDLDGGSAPSGDAADRQRDYIDWALRTALSLGIEPDAVLTEDAAILLAAKLKTPLQIGRHLVRAFEAGFEASVKPIDAATVEGVLSRQIDDLEPQLTRHGYDTKSLADRFDAKPAEIRQLLCGGLDPARARELTDDMLAAGLPL